MSIEQLYKQSCFQESDINEHLPTLYNYGLECKSICEFGVRDTANSTKAFIKALVDKKRSEESSNLDSDIVIDKNLSYIGVDIVPCKVDYIQQTCKEYNIDYTFIVGDSVKVFIPEVDLLFIDSWHVYGHLKRELAKHHSKVKKYIIMHDTTIDGEDGEYMRNKILNHDVYNKIKETGYTFEEITKGLWPAVEEFLETNTDWRIKHRYTNNNGLTILERVTIS
jgi:hypothetical protein